MKTLKIEAVHLETRVRTDGVATAWVALRTEGHLIGVVTIDITDTEYADATK